MDSEHVCPLCCEELDISDQQFFPCKCGYQVCMWCWHRIRETESGLCPACRTPYGDDPHEFSAVDVQEVLKANREKEAAAKRERDRQRQQQQHQHANGDGMVSSNAASSGGAGSSSSTGDDGNGGITGTMDLPKDRTQLANMRVIRRNLVYAVGLPPSIATEEILRKPEYFGQYGKLAKVVLNRSQVSNGGDPRRASCSAYVTFVHKEDTLACILALDGFYIENRSIRASYGTSKYCSAFIKNVRCNNPECTYLHEMGAMEDTFTKQEIQAGYVTSGRDVLARQQQIVQQALSASQGAAGSAPRRRVGGGGPSGTGKGASNPVFPPPEFDEPAKPTLVPAPAGMSRSASTGAGFPTVAAAAAAQQTASKPITRASSVGANGKATTAKKGFLAATSAATDGAPPAATAASVVAGVHAASGGRPASPRTTLTPLTPLKRASKAPSTAKAASTAADAANAISIPNISSNSSFPKPSKTVAPRNSGAAAKNSKNDTSRAASGSSTPDTPPSPSLSAARSTSSSNSALASLNQSDQQPASLSSLGGEVIAPPERSQKPAAVGAIGSSFGGGSRAREPGPVGSDSVNGSGGDILGGGQPYGLSGLGGEVFDGPLASSGQKAAIGSGSGTDMWGSGHLGRSGTNNAGGGIGGQPIGPPGGWNSVGGSTIGGPIGGGVIGGGQGARNAGSSALANILGINLPSGSGSLRESTDLWPNSSVQQPQPPAFGAPGAHMPSQGIIGRSNGNRGLIGGLPIGGNAVGMGNQQSAIGSSNKNDIALLQSLLPEVHITSGGSSSSGTGATPMGWNAGGQHQQAVGVGAVGRNQQAQAQSSAGNLNIW